MVAAWRVTAHLKPDQTEGDTMSTRESFGLVDLLIVVVAIFAALLLPGLAGVGM